MRSAPSKTARRSRVDALALNIHHVVVFQNVLAPVEVVLLDFLLRPLDHFGEKWRIDGLIFFPLPHQQRVGAVAEHAPQVVFQRDMELATRRGRLGGPARPRSWLSMRRDSCRSVPRIYRPPSALTSSRSRAMSWARRSRSGRSCRHRRGRAYRDRRRHRSCRPCAPIPAACRRAGSASHRRRHRPPSFVVGSAQEDVHTATGHVGGDGDRALASGFGDDACFLFVVLGVQDVVRDAVRQSVFETLACLSSSTTKNTRRPCRWSHRPAF